jgi:transposase
VRCVADLPWQGITVRLELSARRFRCDGDLCPQTIFCERLPSVVARYARRTLRLSEALAEIAFALGGRPGSRLARELAMIVSRHTLLRSIRRSATSEYDPPTALGIDDWAKRKGREYGTVLVDLVRRRVIDLLPDRTGETLSAWLIQYPDVQVVTRDRATAYAEAVTSALPQAVQVADRWHLLKNATELLDRLLQRKGHAVREAAKSMRDEWAARVEELPACETRLNVLQKERRQSRLARYEEVMELYRQGASVRAVARTLRLSRNTVTKYVRSEAFPERCHAPPKRSIVEKFAGYVSARWDEGCHNASQLWRELRERGFTGGRNSVWQYLKRQRAGLPAHLQHGSRLPAGMPRPARVSAPSPRSAAWLLQQEEADLRPDENRFVARLLGDAPDIRDATGLVRRFRQMVRGRQAGEFDTWLTEAAASTLSEVRNFAEALRRDYKAVRAALEYDWSNGQAEGQVNRLKLIKRVMYGRAKFDLLKARVLHAT